MMEKVNAACQSLVARTKKNVLGTIAGQQVQSVNNKRPRAHSSANEVFVIGKPGTTVEVFVTSDKRKNGSTMGSSRKSGSGASKITEDSHTKNWSKTLRDQSRPAMKQGVQQLAAQTQSNKHSRHENIERKEIKSTMETHKLQKCAPEQDNRILDEIPVKQAARKSVVLPFSAIPSTTTIASSMESVEVIDRGVQCGGIFDRSNDKFSGFDPVRTLGFLMKEMERLVRDEKSSKMLTDMEQELLRIPTESGKSAPVLEAKTNQLAATSARIESTCAAQREEIKSLLQQVNKQALILEDAKQREKSLDSKVRQLQMELNDTQKSEAESRRTILQLQREKKSIEYTEKMVTELRRDLNQQTELAEQRFMEIQYLQLEREKFLTLSTYKDSKVIELRNQLKDLQKHILELINIREAGKRVKAVSSRDHEQTMIVVGGGACSSPTSSRSITSTVPPFCAEVSEISLSTVDCFANSIAPTKKPLPKSQVQSSDFNGFLDDSETGRPCDKTQLEFISLPCGESSHAISSSQRKDEEGNVLATSHNKKEQPQTSDRKVEGFHSVPNVSGRNARDSLHRVDRDNDDTEPKSKTRKSSSAEKRRSSDGKSASNRENDERTSVNRANGDSASIKQQFETLFEDIRQQSKLPVRAPSPSLNFPRPDWSDSSLPTMSEISESNVV